MVDRRPRARHTGAMEVLVVMVVLCVVTLSAVSYLTRGESGGERGPFDGGD